jgi:transposase
MESIILRSEDAIAEAHKEFWETLWWNRHQSWHEEVKSGRLVHSEVTRPTYKEARRQAKRIEQKYGRRRLLMVDDYELGLLTGRLSPWVG